MGKSVFPGKSYSPLKNLRRVDDPAVRKGVKGLQQVFHPTAVFSHSKHGAILHVTTSCSGNEIDHSVG